MSPGPGGRAETIRQQLRRHPVELRRRKDHRLMVPQRHRDTCVYDRCSRHGELPSTIRNSEHCQDSRTIIG